MFPLKIPSSSIVKNTVKSALKGKRVPATLASLTVVFAYYIVYMLTTSLASVMNDAFKIIATVFFALALIFLVLPLLLGAIRYFWRLTGGADDNPATVFYYFASLFAYRRAVKLILLVIFRLVCVTFVCMLPYFIVNILSDTWLYHLLGTEMPLWVAGMDLLKSFLQVSGICVAVVVSLRYYLVPAIAVMDEDLLLLEAVHISVMVSRRSASAFCGLVASLVGWILLSFFVIPTVYTVPLFIGCYVVHSRFALVNYNLSLDYYEKEGYNLSF